MPIEVSGIKEMLQNIEKKGKNVDKVKEKALKAGAEKIRKPIEQFAQIHRSNINHEHMADNIIISEVKKDGNDEYVEIGPEISDFYANFIEFGTVKMKSEPFVEPGYIQGKKDALETIAEVIREEIEG